MVEIVTINGVEYQRINGYERFDLAKSPLPPVPGVGPILEVVWRDGALLATRSDGNSTVTFRMLNDEWRRVEQ